MQIIIVFALTVLILGVVSVEAVTMKFQSSGKYAFVDFFNDSNCQMISGFVQVLYEMFKIEDEQYIPYPYPMLYPYPAPYPYSFASIGKSMSMAINIYTP